ncbi:peptidase S8/S53 domain-containing protein [Zychaea mexicana]|uniref:peptidase S8/S53 domain-containing protein n=1 Tax=Zychaea mexicana TaxID=64656 RepID=UPI0022FF45FC|nr:peptidase S8/S53 domain-containing protein [Zychaea mexicana]KAI9488316.1 peptidase S8/S53 domain-containing protein [Zychaea mexicana]
MTNAAHYKRELRKLNKFPALIVEFDDSGTGGNNVYGHTESLLNHLKKRFANTSMTVPNVFNHNFMRGATIQADRNHGHLHERIAMIASNFAGVSKVYPVHTITPPSNILRGRAPDDGATVENAELLTPHMQTQVDRVHRELNYTGKGVYIGIIDTGFDYMHPALGGGIGEGYKVRFGRDLVGDAYDGGLTNEPEPDDDPMDSCTSAQTFFGHGTHVAGIIAGKADNYTSVAPDATLAVWRIYSCKDLTTSELVLQSVLEAAEAGVDIISISSGEHTPWSENVFSAVIDRIASNGTKVVVSAGNDGLSGVLTTYSPSVSSQAMSVASFNGNYQLSRLFRISGSDEEYVYIPNRIPGVQGIISDGQIVLGDANFGNGADACNQSTIPDNVRGKLALIARTGGCEPQDKVGNLTTAGAMGVLSFEDEYEYQEEKAPIVQTPQVPIVGISTQAGKRLAEAITNSSGKEEEPFSSVGPTYENILKPDIGGFMYSTVPRSMGSWQTLSGTSMACPYITGATALYLEHLGDRASEYSGMAILERFMNYAYKAPVSNYQDDIDTPLHQGAGLNQLYDSMTQKVHVSPPKLSFNDTAHLIKTHTLTVTNDGDEIASFEVSNIVSVSVVPYNLSSPNNYTFTAPVQYSNDPSATARLRFSRRTIKLSPGDSTEVIVSVIPPDTDPNEHIMYGGYVQFKSTVPSQKDITVPYFVVFVIRLMGTRRALAIVYDQDGHYLLGYVQPPGQLDHLSHTIPRYILRAAIPWTGTYYEIGGDQQDQEEEEEEQEEVESYLEESVTVSRGSTYRIGIQVLKIFGDPNNEDDWERWMSGPIQIR